MDLKRECLSCGATPLSREHVIPGWLSHRMGVQDDRVQAEQGHFRWPAGRTTADRGSPFKLGSMVVRAVCASCNNGWMSRLEVRFEESWGARFTDARGDISPQAAEVASLWLLKTAFMHHQWYPISEVAGLKAAFRALSVNELPPGIVGIGQHLGPRTVNARLQYLKRPELLGSAVCDTLIYRAVIGEVVFALMWPGQEESQGFHSASGFAELSLNGPTQLNAWPIITSPLTI